MKMLLLALSLSITTTAFSNVVVLRLKSSNGADVSIVADRAPIRDNHLVTFAGLRAVENGRSARIDNWSSEIVLRELCRPFAKDYPYTYNTVDGKSFMERVVRVTPNLNVERSNGNVVMRHGYCQKEPY
jgi:hypothetical protein